MPEWGSQPPRSGQDANSMGFFSRGRAVIRGSPLVKRTIVRDVVQGILETHLPRLVRRIAN